MIQSKLGEPVTEEMLKEIDPDISTPEYQPYVDDEEVNRHIPDIDNVTLN